jgi:hypothetical protein
MNHKSIVQTTMEKQFVAKDVKPVAKPVAKPAKNVSNTSPKNLKSSGNINRIDS